MGARRTARILLALAAFLAGLSCFELAPPVEERLALTFQTDGSVEVVLEADVADTRHHFEGYPAAKDRIAEARRQYLSGTDPWTRRFEAVAWERETFSWEKAGGGLVRVRHAGTLADPGELTRFFADLPLVADYARGDGFAELSLVPLPPGRASRAEREALDEAAGAWVTAAREYQRQLADLYVYLEAHPERAKACLGEMYEGCLQPSEKEARPPLLDEEQTRMEVLGDAMMKLVDFVLVQQDQARSLDELARWVHDPFPGETSVTVHGAVLEAEGFERRDGLTVAHAPMGLVRALDLLGSRSVSPDPFPVLLQGALDESKAPRLSLEGLAATPRRAGPPPTEEELRAALDAALAPAPRYRVRWAMAAAPAAPNDGGPPTADGGATAADEGERR